MTSIRSSLQAMLLQGPRANALVLIDRPVGPQGRKPLAQPQFQSQQGYDIGYLYGVDVPRRVGHMVLTFLTPFAGESQRWFNGFCQGVMDAGALLATQGGLGYDDKKPSALCPILVHLWPMTVADQQRAAAAAKAGQFYAPAGNFDIWPLIAPPVWNIGFGGV